MVQRQLLKGNEAIVLGSLLGGATHFFGYPITPASEIAHAAADLFPKAGRHFLQAESETSAINMLYGAASAGSRCMTASSGPGISLMAEGLSYLAGSELPCVVIDVQRAGPGLGNIWPEQSDYNSVVKGGGHGNYHNVVLAPQSAQEMCDFAFRAFEIADRYRIVVCILADAYIGQLMEPVQLPEQMQHASRKEWAVYGDRESRHNLITSIYMNQKQQSALNLKLQEKYQLLAEQIVQYEEYETDDADYIFVAFGIMARLCYSAATELRAQGLRIGLLRPQTLYPFPSARLRELAPSISGYIVAELNNGQMADDVQLAAGGRSTVLRYNWFGGMVPTLEELIEKTKNEFR
jgi:2-oxoisovalerate ferredoxin oxidoreductase alpha subunit